jgi:hypothetical protein
MLRASLRSWQPGRLRSLILGMFLLGGLLATMGRYDATSAPPPAAKDAKDAKAAKDKAGKEPQVKWPEPIKLTIAAKNDEELSQISEMVSTIN